MWRILRIATCVAAIFFVARPLDCFSKAKLTLKVADFCKHGKCAPTADSDGCCKGTVAGGKQLVVSKSTDHSVVLTALDSTVSTAPLSVVANPAPLVEPPPKSPPPVSFNLPLLI